MNIQLTLARKSRRYVRRKRRKFVLVTYVRVGWIIAPWSNQGEWVDYDSDSELVYEFEDPYSVAIGMVEYQNGHNIQEFHNLPPSNINHFENDERDSPNDLDIDFGDNKSKVPPSYSQFTHQKQNNLYHDLLNSQNLEPPAALSITTKCHSPSQGILLTPPITPASNIGLAVSDDLPLKKQLSVSPPSDTLPPTTSERPPSPLIPGLPSGFSNAEPAKQNIFWLDDYGGAAGSRQWTGNTRFIFPDKQSLSVSSSVSVTPPVSEGTLHSVFADERRESTDTVDSWLALELMALESRKGSLSASSSKPSDLSLSSYSDCVSRESSISHMSPLFSPPLAPIKESPTTEPAPNSTQQNLKSMDFNPQDGLLHSHPSGPSGPKWVQSSTDNRLSPYSFSQDPKSTASVDLVSCCKPSPTLDEYKLLELPGLPDIRLSSVSPSRQAFQQSVQILQNEPPLDILHHPKSDATPITSADSEQKPPDETLKLSNEAEANKTVKSNTKIPMSKRFSAWNLRKSKTKKSKKSKC